MRYFALIIALLLLPCAAFAAAIAYPFRVTDNSGNLIAGATIAIGSTSLTVNSAPSSSPTETTVPTSAGEYLLSGAAPASSVSVTVIDFGTGDYDLIYDPTTQGEIYFPLTVSKSGSTISGSNATVAVIATKDSSYVLTALPNAAPGGSGGLPTVNSSNQVAGVSGNVAGSVGSVTGAVGSVTGNVGGNVVGSVASVTAAVTVAGYATDEAPDYLVWGALLSTYNTSGTFGYAGNNTWGGSGGANPWDMLISAHNVAGSFGRLIQAHL